MGTDSHHNINGPKSIPTNWGAAAATNFDGTLGTSDQQEGPSSLCQSAIMQNKTKTNEWSARFIKRASGMHCCSLNLAGNCWNAPFDTLDVWGLYYAWGSRFRLWGQPQLPWHSPSLPHLHSVEWKHVNGLLTLIQLIVHISCHRVGNCGIPQRRGSHEGFTGAPANVCLIHYSSAQPA